MGLSEKAYAMQQLLLEQALSVVQECGCTDGCPACVGPAAEVGADGKQNAQLILKELLAQWQDF